MMRSVYVVALVCFLSSIAAVKSQEITTSVVSSAGREEVVAGSESLLTWTIGESVIDTYDEGSLYILVEGYHQPEVKVSSLALVAQYKDVVSVYPNPTADFITISLKAAVPVIVAQKVKAEVRDLSGRLAYEAEFEGNKHTISLSQLTNGTYLLRLTNAHDNSLIGTYSIEKLQ